MQLNISKYQEDLELEDILLLNFSQEERKMMVQQSTMMVQEQQEEWQIGLYRKPKVSTISIMFNFSLKTITNKTAKEEVKHILFSSLRHYFLA